MSRPGWFADIDDEQEDECRWQPCLETGEGHVPGLPIWFKTEEECREWIRDHVIGVGWYDSELGADIG